MTKNAELKLSIFVEKVSQNRWNSMSSRLRITCFRLILPMNFEILFFLFLAHRARRGISYRTRGGTRIVILSRALQEKSSSCRRAVWPRIPKLEKVYRTGVKFTILMFSRSQPHRYIEFQTGFVLFFRFVSLMKSTLRRMSSFTVRNRMCEGWGPGASARIAYFSSLRSSCDFTEIEYPWSDRK